MLAATTRAPSLILPDALYTKRGKILASGLSETRLREARQRGIECPSLVVGKRKFYRGADIIAFIERLAEASK